MFGVWCLVFGVWGLFLSRFCVVRTRTWGVAVAARPCSKSLFFCDTCAFVQNQFILLHLRIRSKLVLFCYTCAFVQNQCYFVTLANMYKFGFGSGHLEQRTVQLTSDHSGLGFGVWGLGFGVWGLGCRDYLHDSKR